MKKPSFWTAEEIRALETLLEKRVVSMVEHIPCSLIPISEILLKEIFSTQLRPYPVPKEKQSGPLH